MALAVVVAAGTPARLEHDCPSCGWADVWQVAVHSLTLHGVGTIAVVRRCQRCGARQRV
jgi:predicted RNA-binding Zn-ribbon protein involved in translation (DUF1610 family)